MTNYVILKTSKPAGLPLLAIDNAIYSCHEIFTDEMKKEYFITGVLEGISNDHFEVIQNSKHDSRELEVYPLIDLCLESEKTRKFIEEVIGSKAAHVDIHGLVTDTDFLEMLGDRIVIGLDLYLTKSGGKSTLFGISRDESRETIEKKLAQLTVPSEQITKIGALDTSLREMDRKGIFIRLINEGTLHRHFFKEQAYRNP